MQSMYVGIVMIMMMMIGWVWLFVLKMCKEAIAARHGRKGGEVR